MQMIMQLITKKSLNAVLTVLIGKAQVKYADLTRHLNTVLL